MACDWLWSYMYVICVYVNEVSNHDFLFIRSLYEYHWHRVTITHIIQWPSPTLLSKMPQKLEDRTQRVSSSLQFKAIKKIHNRTDSLHKISANHSVPTINRLNDCNLEPNYFLSFFFFFPFFHSFIFFLLYKKNYGSPSVSGGINICGHHFIRWQKL